MKRCKYCNDDITSLSTAHRANHTRWCIKRPDRLEKQQKQSAMLSDVSNKRFGKFKLFNVECDSCEKEFQVKKREFLFDKNGVYHCSRSCANSKGGDALSKKNGSTGRRFYRERAFKIYGTKSCLICGFDKVVEVHHIDHNHDNNVKGNIVILCPNHHMMIHRSKYAEEVKSDIRKVLGEWEC